jgi:hypothetical protein
MSIRAHNQRLHCQHKRKKIVLFSTLQNIKKTYYSILITHYIITFDSRAFFWRGSKLLLTQLNSGVSQVARTNTDDICVFYSITVLCATGFYIGFSMSNKSDSIKIRFQSHHYPPNVQCSPVNVVHYVYNSVKYNRLLCPFLAQWRFRIMTALETNSMLEFPSSSTVCVLTLCPLLRFLLSTICILLCHLCFLLSTLSTFTIHGQKTKSWG